MAFLEIKDLSFTYSLSDAPALSNINLTVNEGELVLICGESGCGKTTLLKLLKRHISPSGVRSGSILLRGIPLDELSDRESACDIGFVMQNPDTQIITDTCISELAFGLQSLGMSASDIAARLAEVSCFFGIGDKHGKKTCRLSGGEKQLLSLASIAAMKPSLLLLDEPTSQLDPIAARKFLSDLKKTVDELGITVIMSEHRLDDVFPIADKIVFMEKGRALFCCPPQEAASRLSDVPSDDVKIGELPAALKICHALKPVSPSPVTVREGRAYLANGLNGKSIHEATLPTPPERGDVCIRLRDASFGYQKSENVIDGLELDLYKGELFCLLGGNGCGKTTLLKLICGLIRPICGEYRLFGKKTDGKKNKGVAYLPQNQRSVLTGDSVEDCFDNIAAALGIDKKTAAERRDKIMSELDLTRLAARHPYDLSGGEEQRLAIGVTLFTQPDVILLDEPTKGQDASSKKRLAEILRSLSESGKTVVVSTHDLDFAATCADRVGLLFGGRLARIDDCKAFFAKNDYYTTAAARISRRFFKNAVTVDDVVNCCTESGFDL